MIFQPIERFVMMCLRSGVITSRLQSPGTRMMKTAPAPPSGNVFQPPDRSVIPWWSRCPGRHTRPSVQQSTWRNVPLAMVIDILVKRFYSKCMYVIYERIKLFTLFLLPLLSLSIAKCIITMAQGRHKRVNVTKMLIFVVILVV